MKRHYCIKCKKKVYEKWMTAVGISRNNRMAWKCQNCPPERRRYGKRWTSSDEERW